MAIELLTFVFADLESSTSLWERFPVAMKAALARHDALLDHAVEDAGGRVVKHTGDGLMAVFSTPRAAVDACLTAQRALIDEPWGETGPLRVRMGIHVGEAEPRQGDFYGPTVNRAARIMSAGHGGQVLLSAAAASEVMEELPDGAGLRDLGEHRLKDLASPERLYQLLHPRLPSDFPPLVTLSERPNNLPAQMSAFLGREAELAEIGSLLGRPEARLLTLLGPGGTGKTRLAIQAAADHVGRFEDGVYLVDLSPERTATEAFEAIARVVGIDTGGAQSPLESLEEGLRSRKMLLLLDNFEQVAEAAPGVAELLEHCPQLSVLVTSREALRVRGERILPVLPLSLPAPREASPAVIARSEAVRLFVERARDVVPGFTLTEDNAADVAEVCRRLDGLPLAIELAAARLRLFTPGELNHRLQHRLQVLKGGPRDLPERQQTLRRTVDWSYDLLEREEAALFQLLSVFSPTTVRAVEEVASAFPPLEDADVPGLLESLIDKSLVRSVLDGTRQRLSMLQTIREYAAEKLGQDPGREGQARSAHAHHFSSIAKELRQRLQGSERPEAIDELAAEVGNLRSAWQFWVGERDLEQLYGLLDVLWVLHDARGAYHEALELTEDMLEVLATQPQTRERLEEEITLRTSLARGLMAVRGYTEEVEEAYARALELSRQAGELPQRFPVLRSLASFHLMRGEFEKAAAVGRELLELSERGGEPDLEAEGHLLYGANRIFLGEVEEGFAHLDRAMELFDSRPVVASRFRLGPSSGVIPYIVSALISWPMGFPDKAAACGEEALSLARRLGHPYTLAYTLYHVGYLALLQQDLALAHRRATALLELADEHDYLVWKALGLVLQGAAEAGLGSGEEALEKTTRGFSLYQGLKTPPVFWPLLLALRAQTCALAGNPAAGLDLVDEALRLSEGAPQNPEFALLKADVLFALGEREKANEWAESAFAAAAAIASRLVQLRAATRLASWSDAGERERRLEVLRQVYDTFTEGFETVPLQEARALLQA